MSNFRSKETGKFLGGSIYYGFDNHERTRLTATVLVDTLNLHEAPLNMEHAVACEIKDNNEIVEATVTTFTEHIVENIAVKGDGKVRFNWLHRQMSEAQKEALQFLADRIMKSLGQEPTEAEKEEYRLREIGTHVGHCCARHGCKYGDEENCPVENKSHKQDHPCESCVDVADAEAQIRELQEEIAFTRSLSA